MANHASAIKRNRQNSRRADVNRQRETRIKSFLKKVEAAIAAGNRKAAQEALREAQPALMRGVSKGVINKATAARKMSRLSARIKKLAT